MKPSLRNVERITAEPGDPDAWHCICGNYPAGGGFYPCDLEGNEMEPTIESDWDGLHVCADCGRIIEMDTRFVVGRNPNPTFLPEGRTWVIGPRS